MLQNGFTLIHYWILFKVATYCNARCLSPSLSGIPSEPSYVYSESETIR